jgi:hypothetical protein
MFRYYEDADNGAVHIQQREGNMPVIQKTKEHTTQLRDSQTGSPLSIGRVVDFSDSAYTASDFTSLMLFMEDSKGPVVQVCGPYKGELTGAVPRNHFFVKKLDLELIKAPLLNFFAKTAERHGLTSSELKKLIEKYAAEVEVPA